MRIQKSLKHTQPIYSNSFFLWLGIVLMSLNLACQNFDSNNMVDNNSPASEISGDTLLTVVQEKTFQYFWDGAEPNSGLARERFHVDGVYPQDDKHIVTTGGSGFGLMALIVGMERGFITRNEGIERFERIAEFLKNADRFHGAWPHWLNGETGEVAPFSQKDDGGDLVETAFLAQGLIAARQYFRDGTEREQQLAEQIDELWRGIEWDWYRKGSENVLHWHWSPSHGWDMDFPLQGYNETLITYVMAAASPTHTIPPEVYHEGWARGGEITSDEVTHGHPLVLDHYNSDTDKGYGGPLFWAHYSYLGLDPRGLTDQYGDYWQLNKSHTLLNRRWCIDNPNGYEGYGEDLWGLTASYTANEDGSVGYKAHRPHDDTGVITPTAALSSMPYTPSHSMDVIENLYHNFGDKTFGPYGFYDAMSVEKNFFPKRYLAIDQGPIVVMIENHRTNLLWNLFMSAPEVKQGLEKLGFDSPHL